MAVDSLVLFNLVLLIPALTLTVGSTTNDPSTTRPTTAPSGCTYNGVHYANGDEITTETDSVYMCYGAYCEDDGVIFWDSECFLRPDNYCPGNSTKVLGQCCPVCHSTSTPPTPPTTIPPTTTMHDGCVHNGIVYANGAEISEDVYNCYGAICEQGQILQWDAECGFRTHPCNGRSVKILGQCCPLCYNDTTSTPPTTPYFVPGCRVNGTTYSHGEEIIPDPTNCSSIVCSYGVVTSSKVQCAYNTRCNGVWTSIPGQCCNVCMEVTSPVYNTSSTPPKTCKDVKCNEVLDCETKNTYKPYGSCCYTCGSVQIESSLLLHFFLVMLVIHGVGDTWT